jgi:hypothetical protein
MRQVEACMYLADMVGGRGGREGGGGLSLANSSNIAKKLNCYSLFLFRAFILLWF